MSCFREDRTTLSERAMALEAELSASSLDEILLHAFEAGMELDEIMYMMNSHTERVVKRYVVQHQLKKAAKKEK